MRITALLGARFKETPADCQIASHILMTRGGYIKNVGSGIFSLFAPAKRITKKIEAILREEMDAIDGQEVMMPVTMPASYWKESGRYDSVGSELLRFKDRNGADMALCMTHEEAVVHLARDAAQSYANYPFMVYHIQTKFRDEPRARGGLIRVREFTMKDAYSFHTTQEDLEEYYQRVYRAYQRIFARVGLKAVVAVKSDSGMMGGKVAHEFMLLSLAGEDSLALCDECDYCSNLEVAECAYAGDDAAADGSKELELAATPGVKTIDDLRGFFGVEARQICKAVAFRKNSDDSKVVVFVRGDLEVNETKLRNILKEEIRPDTEGEERRPDAEGESSLVYGFIGPVGIPSDGVTVLFDNSLRGASGLFAGANREGFHYSGFLPQRDAPGAKYCDLAKTFDGAVCPKCGEPAIRIKRGIEIGNIFQLGVRYSESMNMRYVDADGVSRHPIMGCYGIGVGRLAASVCEESHDDHGPIWPMAIAPWQVHICAIRSDNPRVKETAMSLYNGLQNAGVETMFDDRDVSAGVMFSDADLIGAPIRATVSPKTVGRDAVEISARDKSFVKDAPVGSAVEIIKEMVAFALKPSV